jgi:hypothetical protein
MYIECLPSGATMLRTDGCTHAAAPTSVSATLAKARIFRPLLNE